MPCSGRRTALRSSPRRPRDNYRIAKSGQPARFARAFMLLNGIAETPAVRSGIRVATDSLREAPRF